MQLQRQSQQKDLRRFLSISLGDRDDMAEPAEESKGGSDDEDHAGRTTTPGGPDPDARPDPSLDGGDDDYRHRRSSHGNCKVYLNEKSLIDMLSNNTRVNPKAGAKSVIETLTSKLRQSESLAVAKYGTWEELFPSWR